MCTTIDLSIFDVEQEALAKITEAIARVYFDNVNKRGYDIKLISEAYTVAFNMCPNYRLILKDAPERYKDFRKQPITAEILSLPIKRG